MERGRQALGMGRCLEVSMIYDFMMGMRRKMHSLVWHYTTAFNGHIATKALS
jgi:hypothetical protein